MNFFTGWTTLLTEPAQGYQNATQNKAMAGAAGFGKGLVLFPMDTIGGALNAITFPIAVKIPLPKNGVDLKQLTGNDTLYPDGASAAS